MTVLYCLNYRGFAVFVISDKARLYSVVSFSTVSLSYSVFVFSYEVEDPFVQPRKTLIEIFSGIASIMLKHLKEHLPICDGLNCIHPTDTPPSSDGEALTTLLPATMFGENAFK